MIRARGYADLRMRFLLLMVGFVQGCTPVAEAKVLLELLPFEGEDNVFFRAPKAWLEVRTANGEPAPVEVLYGEQESVRVTSPLPIPCDGSGRCAIQLTLPPQKFTFRLRIEAADRCGERFDVVHFESVTKTLRPYESNVVAFQQPDYELDDDGDGIVNYAEFLLCGRPNWDERGRAPKYCAREEDPCCVDTFLYEGDMVFFAGGAHRLAEGQAVSVSPFWLDATEVTWRQLKRCVAAGVCLAGESNHRVRAQMDSVMDLRLPVTGLNPTEAAQLCAFFGKRLVEDREFDFAVAHRSGQIGRAKFPWDGDDLDVSCQPVDDDTRVASNYGAPGVSCPGAPLPVGSYPTSYVYRAGEIPLADLAGNVSEWTVSTLEDDTNPTVDGEEPTSIPEVPSGVHRVYLRGGGWHSPFRLLENDVWVDASYVGSLSQWREDVERLTHIAGFRCAVDDASYIGTDDEPVCGDSL